VLALAATCAAAAPTTASIAPAAGHTGLAALRSLTPLVSLCLCVQGCTIATLGTKMKFDFAIGIGHEVRVVLS
jgi:hypothetical protein